MKLASLAFCALSLAGLSGCDKIRAMAGKDADGGTTSSSGGGLLGGLFTSDFEGEIAMTASSPTQKAPTSMVFGIKKPKYRVDISGASLGDNPMLGSQGVALILDPPTKKGYALIAQQKKAIVLDFDKMKQLGGTMGGGAGKAGLPSTPAKPPKIDKTGKKDTVAGYSCEIWKVTADDGKRADICVADGITWFDIGDIGWSSPAVAVAAVASEANHFPLRMISYDAKGTEDGRLEATKIDKKTLDAKAFEVPADYQVIDLNQMLQGLGGGLGGIAIPGGVPGTGAGGRIPGSPTGVPRPPSHR